MKTTALVFSAVLIAIALITGATYEQAERVRDRDRLPQIGRSIDIGGEWQTIWRLSNQPQARVALLQELPVVEQSIAQARAAGDLGARPLRVVSQTSTREPLSDQQLGLELQGDLVRLSSRGKQILVHSQTPGFLFYQAPHTVVSAIRDVVLELRQPHP